MAAEAVQHSGCLGAPNRVVLPRLLAFPLAGAQDMLRSQTQAIACDRRTTGAVSHVTQNAPRSRDNIPAGL